MFVRVRPEKQRVLSRSFSTGDISSFRGKGSISDFTRFRENSKLSRNHEAGSFLEGPKKGLLFEHFLIKKECLL